MGHTSIWQSPEDVQSPAVAGEGVMRLADWPLSADILMAKAWSFGVQDAPSPYAPHLRLLPNGSLAGHHVETEWAWTIDDGCLVFLDRRGRRSTRFDQVHVTPSGRLVLRGDFLLLPDRGPAHELREVPPLGGIHKPENLEMIRRGPPASRRNLVVCGANENSLHPKWVRDISEADRNWDLLINFYGDPANFGKDELAEYQTRQVGKGKWMGMHFLCQEGSPVWDYDFIAFPDDDLMMEWGTLNTLFMICVRHGLLLAQPSLRPHDIPISHAITQQDARYRLRYTSFVENMMPVFSREALRACAGSFGLSRSGFGLDNIWPKLLGEPRDRIAIIDEISVLHTRPMAGTYDLAAAVAEGNEVQRLYNAPSRVVEYGAIYAEPNPRQ